MTKPVTRKMAVDCLLHLAIIKCGICHEQLKPVDDVQFDHHHAVVFDGPHEYLNLRPVHAECHKKKTKADVQANAKIKRILKGGRKRKGPPMKSKGFSKTSRPFPKRIKKNASA